MTAITADVKHNHSGPRLHLPSSCLACRENETAIPALRQAQDDLKVLTQILNDMPADDAHRVQRSALTDELHRLTLVVNAMLLATYPRPRIVTAPLDRSVPWMW